MISRRDEAVLKIAIYFYFIYERCKTRAVLIFDETSHNRDDHFLSLQNETRFKKKKTYTHVHERRRNSQSSSTTFLEILTTRIDFFHSFAISDAHHNVLKSQVVFPHYQIHLLHLGFVKDESFFPLSTFISFRKIRHRLDFTLYIFLRAAHTINNIYYL